MKTLIVGYGSIGSRHVRVLKELGCEVAVVSNRDIEFQRSYRRLVEAVEKEQPQYIVIANETCKHYSTLSELIELDYAGIVLVEKPLFKNVENLPKYNFKQTFVAYNLRFHPLIQKLKQLLGQHKIISGHIYVGEYLPNWRPHSDYRKGYSANKVLGGGVLRDLSHELDYANWLMGEWTNLVAMGGKHSELEIDSDDVFNILMTTSSGVLVNIHLNYLDRMKRREIIINTDKGTVKADLINNTLQINENIEHFELEPDFTYRRQHQAILSGDYSSLCSLQEAMLVMKTIQAAEESTIQKRWVSR